MCKVMEIIHDRDQNTRTLHEVGRYTIDAAQTIIQDLRQKYPDRSFYTERC